MYITTHLSSMHIKYLEHCWPSLLRKSPLFRSSDFMMFVTESSDEKLNVTRIERVFSGVRLTVHSRPNPGYNEGAVLAMTEAFELGWFDRYDWVVRVNSDVLIRDHTFLAELFDDETNDGVFADCLDKPCPAGRGCVDRLIHTDFFAVRPRAVPRNAFTAVPGARTMNAEVLATKAFNSVIANGTDAWVPGAGPHHGICRIRGQSSPVIHTHDFDSVYPACLSWYG